MNNIKISLISKNYADALVKLGQDSNISYDEILNNLNTISQICAESNELNLILANPTISDNNKFQIIDEIFSNNIHQKIKDFFKIIIEKKRFNEFSQILAAYSEELDKINNIQRVEVISAIDLNENFKQRIIEKLQNKFNKNIIANWNINEEIISGLVVKCGDNVIDASLKNKLENLSKNIKR